MTQIKLNKASLSLEQKNLKNYQKYLPSLELKRKKLLSERNIVNDQLQVFKEREKTLKDNIEKNLPMASEYIPLVKQLVKIAAIDMREENIVGVKLPIFNSIQFNIQDYAYLNTPHWFENLISAVRALTEIRLQTEVTLSRLQLLTKSIQTVTQRKNLFEKVLIPNALNHIRLIQIFLADSERAAVVRSKIAKRKRQQSS
ncbi:V-type ATP synthase subunit D [Legionella cardiaca]|uniref:V-type ATP synthase subunit D n=1 Tax=Legionella cardiaca TaxID=1071983 RepID=A0ABY8AVC1_9GAMM|nr:V-type ATP synthase subunit D [Legionella cardiaca]WED43356.1 V-type ATP synthase subunit D [Legionella cardiaca]